MWLFAKDTVMTTANDTDIKFQKQETLPNLKRFPWNYFKKLIN